MEDWLARNSGRIAGFLLAAAFLWLFGSPL